MAFNSRLLPHLRSSFHPSSFLTRSIHHPRPAIALARTRQLTSERQSLAKWKMGTIVGVGLVGLNVAWSARQDQGIRSKVWCEPNSIPPPPPPPQSTSIVNPYELGFGAVCGICAGVFIKKGAKLIAFILGGAFVFLQYLNSINLVKINWTKLGHRYEGLTTSNGEKGILTVTRVWNWLVDFCTRDFQQRATFLGGLALGLRMG